MHPILLVKPIQGYGYPLQHGQQGKCGKEYSKGEGGV
jgi:hypothetical protein